jgi:hypothetical protein
MKKIIVLAIPGIGTQHVGFSKHLKDDIEKHSKGTNLATDLRIIELRPFSVTNVDENQRAIFDRLDASNKLGGMLSLRRFVMEAFGDGVTYERDAMLTSSVYRNIHNYLRVQIKQANELLEQSPDSKLIIVAASMGAHILSTYIWDADHSRGIFEDIPAGSQENLRNLDYLATIGCNIPLFLSGMKETEIIAFDKRNEHFAWDNYYDQDDVLGWPLKQLSNSYGQLVTDHEINSGLYVGAHTKYWEDNSFTAPFTRKLLDLYNS